MDIRSVTLFCEPTYDRANAAALAARLNKPLTARLMPLPSLSVGDKAVFDSLYFVDGWVMAVKRDGVQGVMGGNGRLQFKPRIREA